MKPKPHSKFHCAMVQGTPMLHLSGCAVQANKNKPMSAFFHYVMINGPLIGMPQTHRTHQTQLIILSRSTIRIIVLNRLLLRGRDCLVYQLLNVGLSGACIIIETTQAMLLVAARTALTIVMPVSFRCINQQQFCLL